MQYGILTRKPYDPSLHVILFGSGDFLVDFLTFGWENEMQIMQLIAQRICLDGGNMHMKFGVLWVNLN